MDIGTLVGIVGGIILIVFSIIVGGGNIFSFLHVPSFMITFGGLTASIFIAYPSIRVLHFWKIARQAFRDKKMDFPQLIGTLVNFSEKARREGLLALEDDVEEVNDAFLKKGIQLVVDGTDPDLVRNIMMIDLDRTEERHRLGSELYDMAGSLAPAFGMIGTLMGLITMLANLEDKSSIGAGMALALITTFYGAVMANLIFLPVARKLEVRNSEEILLKEIILEGVLSIQSGDNPRIVKDKLTSFLSPGVRDKVSLEINF